MPFPNLIFSCQKTLIVDKVNICNTLRYYETVDAYVSSYFVAE